MEPEKIVLRLQDLQQLLFQLHSISRQVYLPIGGPEIRQETDTEHSYSLSLSTWYVASHLSTRLNTEKILRYALCHDLVEIYAGDVMAIGRTAQQQAAKEKHEAEAIDRLDKEWPDFPGLIQTIRDYEAQSDPEAVFVKTLDKIMAPLITVTAGGSYWKKNRMKRDDVILNKDEKTKPSKEVAELWKIIRKHLLSHDELFTPED